MKHLTGSVRADDPNFADCFDLDGYAIPVDGTLEAHIQRMAVAVVSVDGYYMTTFYDLPTFSNEEPNDVDKILANPERVDVIQLHVSEHEFWFTGIPKFAAGSMMFTTDRHSHENGKVEWPEIIEPETTDGS